MSEAFLQQAVVSAGQHLGSVIQKMIDGVAFPKDNRTYQVFSHEGDELGELSTGDVTFAIGYMKRLGRQVGKLEPWEPDMTIERQLALLSKPAFTFGWVGWYNQRINA